MIDREKVMWSLERCSCGVPDACRDCHYDNYPPRICVRHLTSDALALLKTQEPRVLALDEIHRGMAVWLEDVDKADVMLAIGGSSAVGAKCFITENDMSIAPKDAEYGIRWRAWAAEPTDKQRKEVKWDA